MKTFSTYIIALIFVLFSQYAIAQDSETTASGQEISESEPLPNNDNEVEEAVETMNVEELKALEAESKAKEKEARKEAKEAKNLERQIQKTKNAEARAIKARRTADQQAEKTKSAIEDYMNE